MIEQVLHCPAETGRCAMAREDEHDAIAMKKLMTELTCLLIAEKDPIDARQLDTAYR